MYDSMVDVVSPANPVDDPDDAAAFALYSAKLADAVEAALGPWVEGRVADLLDRYRGGPTADEVAAASAAGNRAVDALMPDLRDLLSTDLDEQATTPLAIVRRAVRYPTEVLHDAGVPPVVRDAFAERQFPDDDYDLCPASLADLDPGLTEIGLTWGAAKAHLHLARRRREGRR
jgi:hypothetical protein